MRGTVNAAMAWSKIPDRFIFLMWWRSNLCYWNGLQKKKKIDHSSPTTPLSPHPFSDSCFLSAFRQKSTIIPLPVDISTGNWMIVDSNILDLSRALENHSNPQIFCPSSHSIHLQKKPNSAKKCHFQKAPIIS